MEGSCIEYLSEWPPHKEGRREREDEKEIQAAPPKRIKSDNSLSSLSAAEQELVVCASTVPTSTLLARWWKSARLRGCKTESDQSAEPAISLSRNPRTLLHHISRQTEARKFLAARVKYLETLEDVPETHQALSATHYYLQNYETALGCARTAVEGDPGNQELMWELELILRQNEVLQKGKEQLEKLGSLAHLQMPNPTQVERRSARDLSYREFFTQYALTHTPVVITDIVNQMVTEMWTFDYIKKVIGSKVAPLKRVVPESVEWAKLEPAGQSSVTQFIDSIFKGTSSSSELKYLFDWSLPLYCPELVEQLTIPQYFAGDLLQRTPPDSLYRDSWPSLFLSPAGITSELHVDAFGSNFWMALFQGRKRWTFFPPQDLPFLYPLYLDSTDAVFQVNLSQPDLTLHPLLSLTHPTQCTLSPGELLFVPAGSPHRVENLAPSLAISANFVDQSNYDIVVRELRVNGLRDSRAQALLEVLGDRAFCRSVDYGQEDLPWKDFKKTWQQFRQTN